VFTIFVVIEEVTKFLGTVLSTVVAIAAIYFPDNKARHVREAIRLQAADFSSFTSTSPQDMQVKNSKFEWPSGFGTLRTSFMMPPQD
jgi:hypothetical protein